MSWSADAFHAEIQTPKQNGADARLCQRTGTRGPGVRACRNCSIWEGQQQRQCVSRREGALPPSHASARGVRTGETACTCGTSGPRAAHGHLPPSGGTPHVRGSDTAASDRRDRKRRAASSASTANSSSRQHVAVQGNAHHVPRHRAHAIARRGPPVATIAAVATVVAAAVRRPAPTLANW